MLCALGFSLLYYPHPRNSTIFTCGVPCVCAYDLALWRALKKHVLHQTPVDPARARTNIWDGDRVSNELLWFFDPNRLYMLPGFCGNCDHIISAADIMAHVPESEHHTLSHGSSVELPCPSCNILTEVYVQHVPGNPRNLLLKLHLDGWLQHGIGPRSTRSVSSVEFMSANISNFESGRAKNISTICFVPDERVPKGRAGTHFINALLGIIVDELMDLFVNGVEVQYKYKMPELDGTMYDSSSPETTTIRVILLCLVADLPARAKMGGWKDGGVSGCYRCAAYSCPKHQGSPTYYFPGALKWYYNRPVTKDRHYASAALRVMSTCTSQEAKERVARQTGVRTRSPFDILYHVSDVFLVSPLLS